MPDNNNIEESVPEQDVEETFTDEAAAADDATGADGEDSAPGEMTLEEQLELSRAEVEKNKDLYLRALADLENYRKRAQREKEEAFRFGNEQLLREILPVIDNLERAMEHVGEDENDVQVLAEGVDMTLAQFRKVLETFGVKPVAASGEPFDPNFHQAMGQVMSADQPPNTVVEELQKGYTLNDRLLRPALVMVAKAPEAQPEQDETPDEAMSDTADEEIASPAVGTDELPAGEDENNEQ